MIRRGIVSLLRFPIGRNQPCNLISVLCTPKATYFQTPRKEGQRGKTRRNKCRLNQNPPKRVDIIITARNCIIRVFIWKVLFGPTMYKQIFMVGQYQEYVSEENVIFNHPAYTLLVGRINFSKRLSAQLNICCPWESGICKFWAFLFNFFGWGRRTWRQCSRNFASFCRLYTDLGKVNSFSTNTTSEYQ